MQALINKHVWELVDEHCLLHKVEATGEPALFRVTINSRFMKDGKKHETGAVIYEGDDEKHATEFHKVCRAAMYLMCKEMMELSLEMVVQGLIKPVLEKTPSNVGPKTRVLGPDGQPAHPGITSAGWRAKAEANRKARLNGNNNGGGEGETTKA